MREHVPEAKFRDQVIENFQYLDKDTNPAIQKLTESQVGQIQKNYTKAHHSITIRIKGKKEKHSKMKRMHCFQRNTRMIVDFSEEMMKAKKQKKNKKLMIFLEK